MAVHGRWMRVQGAENVGLGLVAVGNQVVVAVVERQWAR